MTTRIAVLSDTHMSRAWKRTLPPAAWAEVERAAMVLHCGDVVDDFLLSELRHAAPLSAVLGNNDHALVGVLPETRVVEVDGVRIGMVHDAGRADGRAARMRQRFYNCDVVVFGHSHMPVDMEGVDGQRLFNPGSPTERRQQPNHTMGVLEVDGGVLVGHRIIPVD